MEEFDLCRKVRSVNSISPDENGNVSLNDIYELKDSEYKSTSLRFSRGFHLGCDFANQSLPCGNAEWDAIHQSSTVDKHSNLMFAVNSNSANKTRVVCVKWSDIESERNCVGKTTYSRDFPHQCIAVYRPNKEDPLLIGGLACEYTSDGTVDYSQCDTYKLWNVNVTNNSVSYSLYKSVKILNDFDTTKAVYSTISYDGRYLIVSYTKLDQNKQFTIWNMDTVISATDGQDISNNYVRSFVSPYGTSSFHGQGIFSDGKYIYMLSGSNSSGIRVMSFDGKEISSTFYIRYSLNAEDLPKCEGEYATSIVSEGESIFWANYQGITKMFICVAEKATYPNSHLGRFMHYFDLTDGDIDNSAYTPYRLSNTGIKDANDVLVGNTLAYSGVSNLPIAKTGYLQSHFYPVENQYCRQFYSGLSTYVNQIYTRLVDPKGTGTTPWRKFVTTDRTDDVISVLSNTLAPHSSSTSMSMIFKYQNRFENTKGENYGFMSRYRKNVEPGSENVQSNWAWGSVEGGNAPDGLFSMTVFQNNSTVNTAKFIFTKDNTALLGDSSHKWAKVYATEILGGANSIDCTVDSIGDNWIRYANGLQMCWGSANATQSGYLNTLPKAFVGSNYTLNATYTGTIETLNISVARTSSSTFTVYQSYNENELTVDYIAIGKWK